MAKPIALQLYTVRDQMSANHELALARVTEVGYRHVETAGTAGLSPQDFRARLDRAGLAVMSAHLGLPTQADIQNVVATCRALGCRWVVPSTSPDDFKTLDAIKALAERFQAAAGMLAGNGLRLSIHNHWWEFGRIERRLAIEHFLEYAPDVQMELDIYWASNFGQVDVPGFIRTYAARIPLLHVKDGPLVQGQPHTAVGKGRMNVPACVLAADPRVLEWLIVELDACATDMTEAVQDSFRYLVDNGLGMP